MGQEGKSHQVLQTVIEAGEGVEVGVRTYDLDFRKGVLVAGWTLDWKEMGRE